MQNTKKCFALVFGLRALPRGYAQGLLLNLFLGITARVVRDQTWFNCMQGECLTELYYLSGPQMFFFFLSTSEIKFYYEWSVQSM